MKMGRMGVSLSGVTMSSHNTSINSAQQTMFYWNNENKCKWTPIKILNYLSNAIFSFRIDRPRVLLCEYWALVVSISRICHHNGFISETGFFPPSLNGPLQRLCLRYWLHFFFLILSKVTEIPFTFHIETSFMCSALSLQLSLSLPFCDAVKSCSVKAEE